MDPDSELERRHIEEQLGGAREELAEIKAELQALADIVREALAADTTLPREPD